jgi:hypothetical protein
MKELVVQLSNGRWQRVAHSSVVRGFSGEYSFHDLEKLRVLMLHLLHVCRLPVCSKCVAGLCRSYLWD